MDLAMSLGTLSPPTHWAVIYNHDVLLWGAIVCTKSPPPTSPPYLPPPPLSPPNPPPYPTSPPYLPPLPPPPTSPPYLQLASLERRLASLDAGASPRTPLK